MEARNAAAAVIGAGDYIGAAIARKFALEGFRVFAWVRDRSREREGEEAIENLELSRLMTPASVAETYWQLYKQPRDAWTFEQEIRPCREKW